MATVVAPPVRPQVSSVCNAKEVSQRYLWDDNLNLRDGAKSPTSGKKSAFAAPDSTRESTSDQRLPIIDLALLSSAGDTDRKLLVEKIGSAAENWGFFQVVNHGVPADVIHAMEAHGKEFFHALPVETKEQAVETDPAKHTYYHGYGGRFQHLKARVPWLEYLGECYRPVNGAEGLFQKTWPGVGNPDFCAAAEKYSEALVKLGRQILDLLAESLDLAPDYFSQHFSDSTRYQAHWRFNRYPVCPEPAKTLGLGPHCDPCAMTIVKQDDIGGFQLRNQGRWFDVEPLEGSFLVNIGDCLQAWTNGRFASVLHRALVNDKAERLSIVFPFSPAADLELPIHSSLVDEDHPLRYPAPIEWHHLAVVKGANVRSEFLSSNFGLK